MTKTLTLNISDNTYKLLVKASAQTGQTPEQFVQEWVENKIEQPSPDPLLQLAGVFESNVSNVSEQHDVYLGKALANGA